jgi:hypothetical protein
LSANNVAPAIGNHNAFIPYSLRRILNCESDRPQAFGKMSNAARRNGVGGPARITDPGYNEQQNAQVWCIPREAERLPYKLPSSGVEATPPSQKNRPTYFDRSLELGLFSRRRYA